MRRALLIASGVCLLALLALELRLASLEAGGPTHWDLVLEGGTPATLYLPYGEGRFARQPPPADERPLAVVLMHGYASDRENTSPLARSLARAGYAVLALDVAGHGDNRRAGGILVGRSGKSPFFAELEQAVLFLRTSGFVDGERIVMMGHSMGAGASLGYGSWDPTIDGLVLIAGGWRASGPHRPPNALFIYAEGDSPYLHAGVKELSASLAGRELADGEIAGDFTRATAVAHRMVPGTGHADVATSDPAIREIVAWLDRIAGTERAESVGRDDPRMPLAGLGGLLLVIALPGFGLALARLAPADASPGTAGPVELAVLLVSLIVPLPLIAAGSPLPALSIEIADRAAPYLAAAGTLTLVALGGLGRFDAFALLARPGRSLLAAAVGVLAVNWLIAPLGLVLHGQTLTPERTLIFVALVPLLLPVGLVLEGVLRRGSLWRGIAFSTLGRLLVVFALGSATAAGALPGVFFLMLPILGGVLIAMELPSAAIRAGGGSPLLGALFQMGMLAWILAAVLPVRV
jgi:dienelactone hydrolase